MKVWQDPTFKRRLVADPRAALQEEGVPLPEGKTVRVVEDTAETMHLVLPRKLAAGELTDEQLDHVAGGIVPLILAGAAIGVGVTCLVKGGSEAFGWFE
jgi:nitrile hydratase alpha subunit